MKTEHTPVYRFTEEGTLMKRITESGCEVGVAFDVPTSHHAPIALALNQHDALVAALTDLMNAEAAMVQRSDYLPGLKLAALQDARKSARAALQSPAPETK